MGSMKTKIMNKFLLILSCLALNAYTKAFKDKFKTKNLKQTC